ncbi:MAG: DUF92 domain-containing protein [Candidatus Poseidoniales archaeon]|jgi:uncharacterized protein (TIGR00297 family)
MDFFSSGLNTTNLAVTIVILFALILMSTKAKMLDKNGVIAASVLGFIVGGLGHWTWLIILLGFLLSSHKATKWRFGEKQTLGLCESEDGHRGWKNVVANGFFPGVMCIIAFQFDNYEAGIWIFGASVAVAASDTFASEIGCLDPRVRMITTMKPCEQGENGGFSPNGQLAAFLGSLIVSLCTFISAYLTNVVSFDDGIALTGVLVATGWIGCQIDSILGATLENRGLLTKGTVNAFSILGGVIIMWVYLGMPFFA